MTKKTFEIVLPQYFQSSVQYCMASAICYSVNIIRKTNYEKSTPLKGLREAAGDN